MDFDDEDGPLDPAYDLRIPYILGPHFGWNPMLRGMMTACIDDDPPWMKQLVAGESAEELADQLVRTVNLLRVMMWQDWKEQLLEETDGDDEAARKLFSSSWAAISVHLSAAWADRPHSNPFEPPEPV